MARDYDERPVSRPAEEYPMYSMDMNTGYQTVKNGPNEEWRYDQGTPLAGQPITATANPVGGWGTRGQPIAAGTDINNEPELVYQHDQGQTVVNRNGVPYIRAGNMDPNQVQSIFGSQAVYDPTEGLLIPEAIAKQWFAQQGKDSFIDKIAPILGIGGMMLPAALSIAAGGGVAGGGGATAGLELGAGASGAGAIGSEGLLANLSLEGALHGSSGIGLTQGGGLGLSTTAGGLGLGAGPVSAAALGTGAAGGGFVNTIGQIANSVPPGTTQALQAATQGGGAATGAGAAAATGAASAIPEAGNYGNPFDAVGNSPATGPGTGTIGSPTTYGGSFWDQLLRSIGLPASLAGSIPQIAGALGSYFGQQSLADAQAQAGAEGARLSDPFAPERGFYQGLLKNSYTDPNFFNNNAAFTGMRDQALNATQSRMAAQGYRGSGNMLAELAKVATNEGYKYAQPWQAQVAQNAGAGISPGYAGYLAQQGGNQAAQTNYNSLGNLGVAGQQLFKVLGGLA